MLIAHWPLENNAKDEAYGNYNGTEIGGVSYGDGILGDCYDNTSGSGTGIQLMEHADARKFDNVFSWSLWFKSTTTSGDQYARVIARDCSEYMCMYVDQTESGNQSLGGTGGSAQVNEWHHWAYVHESDRSYRTYLDGQQISSGTEAKDGTARPWVIGGNTEGDGDISGSHFEGKIDDCRFYDHVLSKAEVKELAQGKLLHYKFDSPDVISDSTVGQNTGTNNGANFVEDTAIGSGAYEFQSSDSITTQKGYQVNDHTLAFWIKQESSIDSSYESLIENGNGSVSDSGGGRLPEVFINNDGDGSLHWRWSTDVDGNDGLNTPAGTLELNNWVHLVGVKEGSEYRIYKNGSQIDSVGLSSSGANNGYGDFAIRNDNRNSVQYKLDDIRFYARPISESEVQDLYETKARLDEGHRFFGHQLQENNIRYEWYDTQTYYNNNSHPNSASGLDQFFDPSNSGVNVGGSGIHENSVAWGDSGQAPNSKPSYLPSDGFSWKVDGSIYVPETGTYTFGVDSDDASDVFINGTQVASFYGGHGFNGNFNNNGTIDLEKGNHSFRARMEEGGGGDGIHVAWQKPSDSSFSTVPQENYLHGPSVKSTGTIESTFSEVGPAGNNLIGWWKLNGNLKDFAGKNDGTNNGANVVDGYGQTAYDFNGSSNYIDISSSKWNNYFGDSTENNFWTSSAWVNIDNLNQGYQDSTAGAIIGQRYGTTVVPLGIRENGSIFVNLDDSRGGSPESNDTISENSWFHIVATYKWNDDLSSTPYGESFFYINGQPAGSDTNDSDSASSSSSSLYIGRDNRYDMYVNGKIQDVRIYDKVLTDEEVNVLYEMSTPDARMKKRPEGFYAPQFSETQL
jgi:hypothetical protein